LRVSQADCGLRVGVGSKVLSRLGGQGHLEACLGVITERTWRYHAYRQVFAVGVEPALGPKRRIYRGLKPQAVAELRGD